MSSKSVNLFLNLGKPIKSTKPSTQEGVYTNGNGGLFVERT